MDETPRFDWERGSLILEQSGENETCLLYSVSMFDRDGVEMCKHAENVHYSEACRVFANTIRHVLTVYAD